MADWSLKLMVQQPILPIPASLTERLRYLVIKGKTPKMRKPPQSFVRLRLEAHASMPLPVLPPPTWKQVLGKTPHPTAMVKFMTEFKNWKKSAIFSFVK